jgi:hypothetical protein
VEWTAQRLPSGAEIKTAFWEPILDQTYHFTKTRSGQTWEQLREKGVFRRVDIRDHIAPAPTGLFDATMKDSGTAPNCTPGVSSSCSAVLLPQQSPYYFKVRKTPFRCAIYFHRKTIFLPRQARDEHRKS